MNLGLIGNGFVGNAIYQNLKREYDFLIYDRDVSKANCNSLKELCTTCDLIFVALPTPMYESGECDLSIIFGVMAEIAEHAKEAIVVSF